MSECISCYFDHRGSSIYMFDVEQPAIKVPLVDLKYNKHLPKCSMFYTGDSVYQIRTPVRILNENEHFDTILDEFGAKKYFGNDFDQVGVTFLLNARIHFLDALDILPTRTNNQPAMMVRNLIRKIYFLAEENLIFR